MESNPTSARASRLWWWIVAACALHIAAWTAWFVIATHHPVKEVPIAEGNGR